jgi:ABC-type Fe3+/spermidine/putrescine transport system ATPase subunit
MSLKFKGIKKQLGDFSFDVDIELEGGMLISLLGPSGCGKTTALRIIAGFHHPDTGSIYLEGEDITDVLPRRRNIGLVFQNYALFPHLSVGENIAYGLRTRKWEGIAIRKRVDELLEMVQLTGYGKRRIQELSGGEQQRVALARALAPKPRLLLLDEPLSALDAKLRRELRREIRILQQELGITTIYVTHDQEEALAISDHVVLMKGGRVEQTGRPEELYTDPVSPFSGGFIGISNLLLLSSEAEEKRWMFFRPEDIGTGEGRTFRGKIREIEFYGSFYQALVKTSEGLIKVNFPINHPHKVSDEITFSVPEENLKILK